MGGRGGFVWVRIEGFGVKVVRKIYHLTIWGYQLKEVDCKWCVKLDGIPKQKFGYYYFVLIYVVLIVVLINYVL